MTDETPNTSTSSPVKRLISWLWNPFTHTAGALALFIGVIAILAAGGLGSIENAHFDGVLDTHVGRPAPCWVFLVEGLINWLSLAVVLWIAGLLISGKGRTFRAIDLFGTQALARWPFLLVSLACLLPGFSRYSAGLEKMATSGQIRLPASPLADALTFWCVIFFMLLCLIWFVALAWKSFRISCGLKGGKAVAVFIVGIIIAEVISKIAILKMLMPLI